jgi:hypothetical protein
MAADRTTLADRYARCRAQRRSASDQRHHPRAEERLPLVRLSRSVRTAHDNIQSLRTLGAARHLGNSVSRTCRQWTIHGYADDRLHPRQRAPLGSGRKRGEQKQAVGRSRGGRNTKIHALADAKGRLIAILLTGGPSGCRDPAQPQSCHKPCPQVCARPARRDGSGAPRPDSRALHVRRASPK